MNHLTRILRYVNVIKCKAIFTGAGRIVGGRSRLESESPIPWQVARLQALGGAIGEHHNLYHIFCGGSLLNQKYILSTGMDFAKYDIVWKTEQKYRILILVFYVHKER